MRARHATHPSSRPARRLRIVVLVMVAFTGCARLPKDYTAIPSFAVEPPAEAGLARLADSIAAAHGDESAWMTLERNDEALRWRLALAERAERTIDAQYFTWDADESGSLLIDRVLRAADRGVRVRLLVDDLMSSAKDKEVAALDHHPNVQIRLFNPTRSRNAARFFEFLGRLKQLNHRMHNKLFVVDNRLVVVGGRNIGDAYFGLSEKYNYRDLDVLAAGPVVAGLSAAFDLYWNSDSVVPGEALAPKAARAELLERVRADIAADLANWQATTEAIVLAPEVWERRLEALPQEMTAGAARIVYDEPLVGPDNPPVQMADELTDIADDAREEILVVSAYFIPDQQFIDDVAEITGQGVRVRILTNSLASNDWSISNSAYRRWRKPLIEAGVELHELRHDAEFQIDHEASHVEGKFLGLHTKAIVIDCSRVYVGSLNLDPRSLYLNTELGLVIDDAGLGEELCETLGVDFEPSNSWRVRLDDEGKLYWESAAGTVQKQPARGPGQRWLDRFYRLLPIKKQL